MRSTRIWPMIPAALVALVATPALQAQTHRAHIGPRIGYNFDAEAITIGGQLSLPIASHLEFYPSVDAHLVDRGSLMGINLDLKYRFPASTARWLYAGGGLGILRRSIDDNSRSDAGLNLFLGAESLRGRVHPFAEGRVLIADGSTAQIVGGLNFTL